MPKGEPSFESYDINLQQLLCKYLKNNHLCLLKDLNSQLSKITNLDLLSNQNLKIISAEKQKKRQAMVRRYASQANAKNQF